MELELLRQSECEVLAMLDEMAGEISYESWSSSSPRETASSYDDSEPESGPTPCGGIKRERSWTADSDGAGPLYKRQRSRGEMPNCCEVLEHVAATLDKSGRTARRWDACAIQWNAAKGRADGHVMKSDNFKMHVKRLLAERKQRSHTRLWAAIWGAPSRECLGEVLRCRLEPLGPSWPVDAMADFLWAVKSDHSRANYCNFDLWDATVREQVVDAAVRLHREGVPVVRHLAAVFPAFNVEMMILSACRCDACALFGAPTSDEYESMQGVLLEFTKRKSAFIAHALRCIDAAGGSESPEEALHRAFIDMRLSQWAPFVNKCSFADFSTIIRPAVSDRRHKRPTR